MRPRGQTPRMLGFSAPWPAIGLRFNEAAGADPADALAEAWLRDALNLASMRPRGQTPRMRPLATEEIDMAIELQ